MMIRKTLGALGFILTGVALVKAEGLLPKHEPALGTSFGSVAEAGVAGTPGFAGGDEATLPANIFVNLAKKAVPSVVNISTVTTIKRMGYSMGTPLDPEDMLRRFFGEGMPGFHGGQMVPRAPSVKQSALGTGFVIDPAGVILTNNHVVAGADEIKIQFAENDEPVPGKVIGRDADLDVALIRVKTSRKLTSLSLGDSDALQVGEYVMAVGNPYGQGHSVSHGIVSAKGRTAPGLPVANYLQIDAPINPGNSGGPLLNLKGEVVGINNAIDPRAQGIGFAIPINFVKSVLVDLENGRRVARGFIGAGVGQTTPDISEKIGAPSDLHAPFVTEVASGSPAAKAGIQPYDAILSFNSKPVHTPAELVQAVTQVPVGKSVPVEVLREGQKRALTVTVAVRPGAETAENGRGTEESEKPARAGLALRKSASGAGVVIAGIAPDSPAAAAGLQDGDVILEIDRKPVSSPEQAKKLLSANKSYLMRIERKGTAEAGIGRDAYAVVILDLKNRPDEG